jgi:hypothetical protein
MAPCFHLLQFKSKRVELNDDPSDVYPYTFVHRWNYALWVNGKLPGNAACQTRGQTNNGHEQRHVPD